MSRFAARLQRVGGRSAGNGSGSIPGGTITHGDELTLSNVGPWTLQGVAKGSETLSTLTTLQLSERLSTWPTDGKPSWIPSTDYVYDNNPSNYGGVVPAGGMIIDGYNVPAGTWVCQFRDLSNGGVIISGDNSGTSAAWPGVVFRGCRMRSTWTAPGWFNQNSQSPGGLIWIMYSDAGAPALSLNPADMCESIFETQGLDTRGGDHLYVIRTYLSNATTLCFGRNSGDAFIENYGEGVSDFGDSTKHLNGIANSGGQECTLWLRNHLVFPLESGSTIQTDVIQMAADNGTYMGTGTNLDGSPGYTIKDNYLGGAQYILQLGLDKTNTVNDVRNVRVIGNKITTSVWANGGSAGISYKNPDFTLYGNTWSGNVWADGASAGQTIAAPSVG